jgi:hypothetical protein
MNEEQKEQIKKTVGSVADELSDKALAEARNQTNKFWKLLLYIVGTLLAGIAALAGFTGCNSVPRVELTVEQIQAVETLYTAAGGEVKYRVVPVENIEK